MPNLNASFQNIDNQGYSLGNLISQYDQANPSQPSWWRSSAPVGTSTALAGVTGSAVPGTTNLPQTPYVSTYNPTPVVNTPSSLAAPTTSAINDQLAGKLGLDTLNQLAQYGAERGAGGGFGVGDPNANAAVMRALGLTSNELVNRGIGNSFNQQGIDNQSSQYAQTLRNNQEQFAATLGLHYDELNAEQKRFVDSQAQQRTEFDLQLNQHAIDSANNLRLGYYQASNRGGGGGGGSSRPGGGTTTPIPGNGGGTSGGGNWADYRNNFVPGGGGGTVGPGGTGGGGMTQAEWDFWNGTGGGGTSVTGNLGDLGFGDWYAPNGNNYNDWVGTFE